MSSRTKIVATVGPASDSPAVLEELILAGVDVFRLNLSHGPVETHLARMRTVREVADRLGATVAVLADLPGPKIRAGRFPEGGIQWVEGDAVQLRVGNTESTASIVDVDCATLLEDVEPGGRCVIGDGAITLMVNSVAGGMVNCSVTSGGRVTGQPGVHLPSEHSQLTTPTAQDLELVVSMADADFVALSFVRSGEDVRKLRAAIVDGGPKIVAKIETAAAMNALDDIITEADALMVARGDLGIDCPLEDVPHLQKKIIRRCVERGVPVITATQMLESMITSPAPTRAEVTDIANAVFDGTDALMLSAETAVGHDPALVVRTMNRIAERAEVDAAYRAWARRLGRLQRSERADAASQITYAMTHAAHQASVDIGVSAILCCTRSGRTALAMASYRPEATLIGLTPSVRTARALALSWGIEPLQASLSMSTDEMIWLAVESALAAHLINHGNTIIVLAGTPDGGPGASNATDVLRVVTVA